MAVTLKAIADLDPELVDQQTAEIQARVQEANPTLHVGLGVFRDLLISYNGMLGAQRQDQVNQYLRARSLADLAADPDLADPDLVDAVLSNYRLTRNEGAAAAGEVTLVFTSDLTVTIAQGAVWAANGRQFVTPRVYTAKREAGQVNDAGDRVYARTADGNWAVTIALDAVDPGPGGNVPKDTRFVPAVVPTNFLTAFAADDFAGGAAAETNRELVERLQEGIAARAPSNRVNMRAMLRADPRFARVVASSILGYGDPEQLRDRHWIFPVAGGGRADWYVRTQLPLYRRTVTKTATLVAVDAAGLGTWRFALARDDFPGFYEVAGVRPDGVAGQGGFPPAEDARGTDLTGLDYPAPDVQTQAEAAYTRFQTAVVSFVDTLTPAAGLAVGDTAAYAVEVVGLPQIGEIQDFVSARDVSHHAADVLVRAPVPCFVALNFEVYKRAGDDDPDLDAMRAALCDAVNGVGFVGRVAASQVHDVIHNYLGTAQTASAVDLLGRLRYPDGTTRYLRDAEALAVPDDPANMVTARTVQFFLDPQDIGITVKTTVPPLA